MKVRLRVRRCRRGRMWAEMERRELCQQGGVTGRKIERRRENKDDRDEI